MSTPTPEQVAEALAWMGYHTDDLALLSESSRPIIRHAATLVRAALAAETETWTEVRLRGQPPGSSPYDFTFRSDRDHWQYVDDFLNRITETWTDVRVESRQVTTTRVETPWTEQQT